MPTTKEVLIAARKRIDRPDRWCQGVSHGPGGALCTFAAIAEVHRPSARDVNSPPLRALRSAMGETSVVLFNDSHTHAEVLAAFDKAIAAS